MRAILECLARARKRCGHRSQRRIEVNLHNLASAPEPNWAFNADANTGHGFAIFMASVGALRASRSGAG